LYPVGSSGLLWFGRGSFYGSIAAFSLTFISDFLIHQQILLQLVGGAFLCYLGVRTFLSAPADISKQSDKVNIASAYASTFFLTLTNPLTILSFAAIFAGMGLANWRNYTSAGHCAGVFSDLSCWWIFLSELGLSGD
jgi:threonine/homoserine/homoserine lactone efflux protein